jgi:hypothetical protein
MNTLEEQRKEILGNLHVDLWKKTTRADDLLMALIAKEHSSQLIELVDWMLARANERRELGYRFEWWHQTMTIARAMRFADSGLEVSFLARAVAYRVIQQDWDEETEIVGEIRRRFGNPFRKGGGE